MAYRKTRKHKSRKSKSRRYRRQRGGDEQPPTNEQQTNITETINTSLNKANEAIGDVKEKTESTVSGWFGSIGSMFGATDNNQPTTPQTAGKKRRRKHKRTHKK
jgi:hypothetical protein